MKKNYFTCVVEPITLFRPSFTMKIHVTGYYQALRLKVIYKNRSGVKSNYSNFKYNGKSI
ncbi:MAG: hypothetical protein IT249_09455 [Chitinophagaceae bacterium]|nr:hypothetical protein [Chitinophagaceae bacterium]